MINRKSKDDIKRMRHAGHIVALVHQEMKKVVEPGISTKELDDKTSEFQYDKGWYSITDIVGEEKNVVYKSKNAQEAYYKWNVYIGRKKERTSSEYKKNDSK